MNGYITSRSYAKKEVHRWNELHLMFNGSNMANKNSFGYILFN